jgi:cold shock CspA family protein
MALDDRKLGTVVRILRDKGYGFIKISGESDVFFHMNALEGCTLDDLHDGHDGTEMPPTIVTFKIGESRKGRRQADDVQICIR